MDMRKLLVCALMLLAGWSPTWAGTVTFSDQVGNYFGFRSMKETGELVPPSKLEPPSLYTIPRDTIHFSPSAYVAVESTGPTSATSTLSTQLALTLQSLGSLGLSELNVAVAGTWATTLYLGSGSASVDLGLQLDLIMGGITRNFIVPISRNMVDNTWAGSLTVTQQMLNDSFSVPSTGILEIGVAATPVVSATATYANARSAITSLDLSAKPVPEPGPGSLLLVAIVVLLLVRRVRVGERGL